MLKAVILDFDGLIIDTEVVSYNIFKEWFLKNKNYSLSVEDFTVCVGSNNDSLFNLLENEKGIYIDKDTFHSEVSVLYKSQIELLDARPGVPEFIKAIKNKGLKLALATSSPVEKPTFHLTRLGLINEFDALITADLVKRIKPYPDLYLKALEVLKIDAGDVLAVEDSYNGYLSATKAGVRVLVVPNKVTEHLDFTGCYDLVESLEGYSVDALINRF